jgi:flagellar motor component MotA
MDRTSVLGLLIGVLAIVGGQILEGGHVGSLSQPTALLIVVGGTLGRGHVAEPVCDLRAWHPHGEMGFSPAGFGPAALDPADFGLEPGVAA